MKKKFESSDIEQYFQITNNIAPIYNDEKVHQIINSPKAVARLKGNKFKPLKFIIMTSITAIIISAILFWPGKNTPSTPVENTGASTEMHAPEQHAPIENQPESKAQFAENIEIENEPESELITQEISSQIKPENEAKDDTLPVEDEKQPHTPKKSIENTTAHIDTSTIETQKGDIKQVIADQKLLEKLGFTFIEQSVYYQNESGKHETQSYSYVYFENDNATYSYLMGLSSKYTTDSVGFTKNAFYPVAFSYISGSVKYSIYDEEEYDLESAADTLFPVFIPNGLINNDANDFVLWFNVNQEFFDILPGNLSGLNAEYDKRKKIKRAYPEIKLVDYKQPSIIDPSRFIELTTEELFSMGFSQSEDSTLIMDENGNPTITPILVFSDSNDKPTLKYEVGKSGSRINNYSYSDFDKTEAPLAFVTRTNGDILYTSESKNNIENIVPIVVRQDKFPEMLENDLLFWFLPSDYLFSRLPEAIAHDLKDEYNYIVAEDKSALVKPECNFYEECRNTLLINNFRVYPNPANQYATVSFELPKAIIGRISLLDLQGREKMVLLNKTTISQGQQKFELDLSGISNGIYLLTLFSESGVQTQRLVVQR